MITGDYEDAFDEFIGEIVAETVEMQKKAALATVKSISRHSPIETGSYIKSHRIGHNAISPEPPTKLFGFGSESMRVEVALSLSARIKALALKPGDAIFISNSTPHAMEIELTGWESGRPPYKIYRKALQAAKAELG